MIYDYRTLLRLKKNKHYTMSKEQREALAKFESGETAEMTTDEDMAVTFGVLPKQTGELKRIPNR